MPEASIIDNVSVVYFDKEPHRSPRVCCRLIACDCCGPPVVFNEIPKAHCCCCCVDWRSCYGEGIYLSSSNCCDLQIYLCCGIPCFQCWGGNSAVATKYCCGCCCPPDITWLRFRNSEAFLAKYRGALDAYAAKHGIRKSEHAVFRYTSPGVCCCSEYGEIKAVAPTPLALSSQVMDRGDESPPPQSPVVNRGSVVRVEQVEEDSVGANKIHLEEYDYQPGATEEDIEPTSSPTTSEQEDFLVEEDERGVEVSFEEDLDDFSRRSYRQGGPRTSNNPASPQHDYNTHDTEIARLKERTNEMRERRARIREQQATAPAADAGVGSVWGGLFSST